MKRNLFITIILILLFVSFGVFIDIPQSPLWGQKIKASLGLDLVGGTQLIYEADLSKSVDKTKDLNNLSSVFRNRIDELGVAEPSIQTSGSNRIIVELPGIKNINEAVNRIGQTYDLVFMTETTDPSGIELKDYYDPNYTYPMKWQASDLTGRDLTKSEVTFQGNNSQQIQSEPVVSIRFNNAGKEKFAALTKANINKRLAIVLDNKIVSAPTVSTEIGSGEAIISGLSDIKEAQTLANRLNEGMLPVPATLVGQQNIGATLGINSVKSSIVAGMIGLFLVAVFMFFYYRTAGLVAIVALIFYSILTLATYKIIPVTLTLAGIAGFILSIGMAIDANILIFERMKEELRNGKDLNLSITDGFKRSWSSIRDSNFSSLITCTILYISSGSGPVRGFALTLGLGIIISMFTAITVTRTILLIISQTNMRKLIHV